MWDLVSWRLEVMEVQQWRRTHGEITGLAVDLHTQIRREMILLGAARLR